MLPHVLPCLPIVHPSGPDQIQMNYLRNYLASIVYINSLPQRRRIPTYVYCLSIVFYFTQAFSNMLHIEQISNWFLELIGTLTQATTLIHIVKMVESSFLFWTVYLLLHGAAYIFILISLLLTINRRRFKPYFYAINDWLTLFSSSFPLILADIFVEFNMIQLDEVSFAGALGIVGLTFTLLFTPISCLACQSYEFCDINQLKRRLSLIILNAYVKIGMVFLSDADNNKWSIITLSMLFSSLSLADAFLFHPFANINVAKTYIGAAAFTFGGVIICTSYIAGFLNQDNIIATIVGICPLASNLALTIYEGIEIKLLQNAHNDSMNWIKTQLLLQISQDPFERFKLMMCLRNHVNNCRNTKCFCNRYGDIASLNSQKNDSSDSQSQRCLVELNIGQAEVIKLVDSMLQQQLLEPHHPILDFMYVTFIERYLNNMLQSYFNLKRIQKNGFSIFYSILYQELSQKLEEAILVSNLQRSKQFEQDQDQVGLNLLDIVRIDQKCPQLTQIFISALQIKLAIWKTLQQGNDQISRLLGNLQNDLQRFMRLKHRAKKIILELSTSDSNSAYLRLIQLYHLFISNQVGKVQMLEKQIGDLRNKDQYREAVELNNYNFMNDQSVLIRAGLARQLGVILNRDNKKIAQFFGYANEELKELHMITDLMPKHVANLHNLILFQYLQKGSSPLLYTTRKIFLMNKSKYLFPVAISVRNEFANFDDCIFNVNLLKIPFKDLIMFDRYGAIIGISENLFNLISKDGNLFTYNEIIKHGLIQVLMPKLVQVLESADFNLETEDDSINQQFDNLQCSIVTEAQTLQKCFNLQSQTFESGGTAKTRESHFLEIVNKTHRESIRNYLTQHLSKSRESTFSFKLRFILHSFFRKFKNLDIGVMNLMGYNVEKQTNLHYFVIEVIEIEKSNNKQSQTESHLDQVENRELDDEVAELSERKEALICNHYDSLVVSPRFQIDSPRLALETPKDTDRALLTQQNIFDNLKSLFSKFQPSKITYDQNPRFLSKNHLQEEGLPEPYDVVEKPNQPENPQMSNIETLKTQKLKKAKPKRLVEEQTSQTSAVSKSDRENLDEIYDSVRRPASVVQLHRLKLLALAMLAICLIVQSAIGIIRLDILSLSGEHLILAFQFNTNYINYCQSKLQLQVNGPRDQRPAMEIDRIRKVQNRMLYEEANIYMQFDNLEIETLWYNDLLQASTEIQGLYEFQMTNLVLFNDETELGLRNTLSRFFGNRQFSISFKKAQLEFITSEVESLTAYFQWLVYIFIAFMMVPVFPVIKSNLRMNSYIEKIILLVTRVNFDESEKEISKINEMKQHLAQVEGNSLLINEFVPSFINKLFAIRSKTSLLQTKIYNQKLPIGSQLAVTSAEFFVMLMFLIGGVIIASRLPENFREESSAFLAKGSIYERVQQKNLFLEMIQQNMTIIAQEEFIKQNSELLNVYDEIRYPLESSSKFDEYYYGDLCDLIANCTQLHQRYYNRGLAGVLSQISALFTKDQIYVSDSKSPEYQALILDFPYFITPIIEKVNQIANEDLYQQFLSYKDQFIYYFILGGILVIIVLLAWVHFTMAYFTTRIKLVRHLLILVPYEKLSDEITLSLIKAIKLY